MSRSFQSSASSGALTTEERWSGCRITGENLIPDCCQQQTQKVSLEMLQLNVKGKDSRMI